MWFKKQFRGHPVHLQPPTFCGFHPLELPNKTPGPPYHWSVRGARGQLDPHTVRANSGSSGAGRKKNDFSKFVPRPLGMLKQVFLARFEPVVTNFSLRKTQNALKMGSFGTKDVSKTCFPKSDRGPFGVNKQVKRAHFEPILSHSSPSKVPKNLENGPFCVQKRVKITSKMCFSKNDLDRLGCSNWIIASIWTHFSPSSHSNAPRCTLLTYLRARCGAT